MEKQHLTYFKIENFKRFDSFEMSNLGQFNLIVGDNNVGKTSVLEALTFDEDINRLAHAYLSMAVTRHKHNFADGLNKESIQATDFWSYFFKRISEPINVQINQNEKYSISILAQNNLSEIDKVFIRNNIVSNLSNKWLKLNSTINGNESFNITGAYFENLNLNIDHYTPFVEANANYTNSLVDFFYEYFNSNKEARKELERNSKMFISDIEEIRVHKFRANQEVLSLTLFDNNGIFPITRYGDGTVKVLRILMEISITKNRRLMVDEIGSGIHFTRLKGYWQIIIQLCAKYNVQLFATTHSLECQQAFVEALEDSEMQQYQADARNITLLENKQGDVKAFTYTFEEFEFSLANGINTRGGQR
ncbi:AAA family ATPase [Spirosoma pollinicola]|uniref:ATPase n=1 Tax=Spirosoma pollinicola TaxID=2057025 RepID=A0A2K8Z1M3_9BACT|nr:ATP-binding protein [Spirosoma pollinicola]AUD03739.1 ATPase [Spirosoma pollinicola]